ncbi:MAG: TonB-dependent receptor [Haliscomenobacter sp.]|nr:TonB-dependent receptor [Haliscomenobacter sp.]
MRSILCTLLFSLLIMGSAAAQNKTAAIKGKVLDTQDQPLPMATVMLLQAADSVLSTFGMTDEKGLFSLPKTTKGKYILQVSYLGFQNYQKNVEITGNEESIDAGTIKLEGQSELLSEVVVQGEANPLNIKKDTIEYNAVAFKTEPNAAAEELLKKLPGVEIDADGAVKAQGENVTRILVDGKEFFGRDPKAATRNLPADAIDKIQIFDKLSDQAEFSGVDDGNREKTINISLREDRRRGVFGTISAGGGTAPDLPSSETGRYEGKLNINRFSQNQHLTILASANNVNQEAFSRDEYMGFTGGGGGGGSRGGAGGAMVVVRQGGGGGGGSVGGSTGFSNIYSGGLNFNRSFSKNTDFQSSYSYLLQDRRTDQTSNKESFLNNSESFFTDSENNSNRINGRHMFNFRLDQKLDTAQNIRLSASATFSDADYNQLSSTINKNNEKILSSESYRDNTSNGKNFSLNSNLLYRKRFGKPGRNLSANLSLVAGNDDSDGYNNSFNNYYTGANPVFDTLNQNFLQNNRRLNYGARLSYVEPAGGYNFLEFTYDFQNNQNDFSQEVYDVYGLVQPELNIELTNQYEVAFSYHQAGLNWRFAKEGLVASLGANYQQSLLDGTLLLSETQIKRDFSAFLPSFRARWEFGTSKFLNLDYRTNINAPSIQQLQPVADNSNPLYITEGNPDLKPEYSHSVNMRVGSFNQFSFTNLFAFVNFTYGKDRIRNAQTIDENFVTTTRPVNVDDDYRIFSNISYGTRIRPIKMSFNMDLGYSWNRGITFINAVSNWTTTSIPSTGIRLENYRKEIVDWSLGARLRYTHSTYDVASEQNRDFVNHTYTANVRVPMFKKKFNIASNLNYSLYNGISDDFSTDIPICNAYMSLNFLKGDKGQLKVSVYDLLNKNQGVNIVNDLNYYLNERTLSLGRYFTVGFTYSLKSIGGGGNVRQSGPTFIMPH